MKLNERVFELLDGEPVEVQQLDDHTVEIFMLNDYPDIMQEFINKGKFAVWSSVDGTNYRLAIEKDYYENLNALYSNKVNNVWLRFWDECDAHSKKFTRRVVIPGTILAIVAFVLISILLRNNPIGTYLIIGLAALYMIIVLVFRKFTTKKINESNKNALDDIKKFLGAERFQELLDAQRKFMDDYYEKLSAEADEADRLFEEEEAKRLEAEATNDEVVSEADEETLENEDALEAEIVEEDKQ